MKKTYKYETHVHTKEGSACASGTGQEMVRAHIEAGYSGMIVTDHFFNGNTAVPADLPWESRVELFCQGYENAVEEAKGTGFHVFFAWEYSYRGTDFLTYGLGKEFLLEHRDILDWSTEEYLDIVRDSGGFICHAHPFREAFYIDALRLYPDRVNAVEVINASHADPRFNEKALVYAAKHNLIKFSGSDTHHIDALFGGGLEFDFEIKSMEEFIAAVNTRNYRLLEGN